MKPAINIPKPSYSFAKRHGLLVGQDAQGKIMVMYRDSLKPQVVAELRRFIAKPFKLSKGDSEEFDKLLSSFYGDNQDTEAMMQDFGEDLDLDEVAESLGESQDLLEAEDDAPIIRLINAILRQAIKENASDIHFETFENRLAVRLRVDGVLREILQPPRELASLIVSRLKVMANLDIAEKRLPQDGRITRSIGGHVIDMRMSTLPSGPGERVVLRLLDRQAGRLDLAELGMPSETMEHINELIRRPHGIFLVTGPTGSGKTTTLYASLLQLNDNQRNILTVEDPIEYYLDGVGQTQVNNKVEMSFARGLRAILRQDPDVVMVGEIRDLETAEIGVQASLTGHMVFSTLHTNTAIGAVTRMRDMGVEPFLLSSTLVGVLAQRLVRKLCARCRYPEIATPLERKRMGLAEDGDPVHIYRPHGCDECSHTGYVGRTGIYELVVVDESLRQMIHDNASEYDMEKQARKITKGIREDGMAKVLDGVTTLEEVVRVTREF